MRQLTDTKASLPYASTEEASAYEDAGTEQLLLGHTDALQNLFPRDPEFWDGS